MNDTIDHLAEYTPAQLAAAGIRPSPKQGQRNPCFYPPDSSDAAKAVATA